MPPPPRRQQPPHPGRKPVAKPISKPVSRPAAHPAVIPGQPRDLTVTPVKKEIAVPKSKSRELNMGTPDHWVRSLPVCGPFPPVTSKAVLYAVIGTWYEGDIIEACIKNCFVNGCEKVFLVDNDSPDDTVERAIKAGATVAEIYETDFYCDDTRLRIMNRVMWEQTTLAALPELWWLSLDADEFPCGPHGEPLVEFLSTLNSNYNAIGANAIDLYPTPNYHYEFGKHPADCMKMGMRRGAAKGAFCHRGHWKHPILKARNGEYLLAQSRGSHTPFCPANLGKPVVTVREPVLEIPLFHCPFRREEDTRKRLEAICGKNPELGGHSRGSLDDNATSSNGSIKRWRCLNAVYNQQWDKVEMPHCQQFGKHVVGIALYPWERLVPLVQTLPRWYSPSPQVGLNGMPTKIALPVVGNT